jgi:hypothetical protein
MPTWRQTLAIFPGCVPFPQECICLVSGIPLRFIHRFPPHSPCML